MVVWPNTQVPIWGFFLKQDPTAAGAYRRSPKTQNGAHWKRPLNVWKQSYRKLFACERYPLDCRLALVATLIFTFSHCEANAVRKLRRRTKVAQSFYRCAQSFNCSHSLPMDLIKKNRYSIYSQYWLWKLGVFSNGNVLNCLHESMMDMSRGEISRRINTATRRSRKNVKGVLNDLFRDSMYLAIIVIL